jgi:hypothetical protein
MNEHQEQDLNDALETWATWILNGFVAGLGYPAQSTIARMMESGITGAAAGPSLPRGVTIVMPNGAARIIAAIEHLQASPIGRRQAAAVEVHYLACNLPLAERQQILTDYLRSMGEKLDRPVSRSGYFERLNRGKEALDDVLWRLENQVKRAA